MFGLLPPIQDKREFKKDPNKKKNINFPKPLKIINVIFYLVAFMIVLSFLIALNSFATLSIFTNVSAEGK